MAENRRRIAKTMERTSRKTRKNKRRTTERRRTYTAGMEAGTAASC